MIWSDPVAGRFPGNPTMLLIYAFSLSEASLEILAILLELIGIISLRERKRERDVGGCSDTMRVYFL